MSKQFTPTEAIKNGLVLLDDEDHSKGGFRIHRQKSGALMIATVNAGWKGAGLSIKSVPVSPDVLDAMIEALESLKTPLLKAIKKGQDKGSEDKPSKGKDKPGKVKKSKGKDVTPEEAFQRALDGLHLNSRVPMERLLSQPHTKVLAPKQAKAYRKLKKQADKTQSLIGIHALRPLCRKVKSKADKGS